MFHYLIGALILICMTMTFTQQYQVRGALNAYYGLYKGIVETSVTAYDEQGTKIYPYFNEEVLFARVGDYLDENLKPYVRRYLLNVHFSVYHTPRHASKVELVITMEFNDISRAEKTAIFEVRSNIENE